MGTVSTQKLGVSCWCLHWDTITEDYQCYASREDSLLEGTEQTRKPRALFQVTSGPNQSDFMFENEILVPGWIQKEYSFPGLFLEYPWHVEIS